MELLQLRYFFDSAKTESFAKTAEKYMVPASSVSASVKRLEKELGCALFDRACNRITLNENGRKLQKSLYIIFNELEDAVDNLSATNGDTREIKMLVRAIRSKITDYIIEYKKKHPHIAFKIVFNLGEANFENYDIIIDEQRDIYQEFKKFELCRLRFFIKAAKDSPLCGKSYTLKQLANQDFVSMGEQTNMHKILINACKRAGFSPNIVVETNDSHCYNKCLASGIGIGLGRSSAFEEKADVRELDVTDFNEGQDIFVYYKKQSAYGNVKHFLDFLQKKVVV